MKPPLKVSISSAHLSFSLKDNDAMRAPVSRPSPLLIFRSDQMIYRCLSFCLPITPCFSHKSYI